MTAQDLTAAVEDRAQQRRLFASFDVDAFEGSARPRRRSGSSPRCGGCVALHGGSARATGNATITVGERPGVYTQTVRRGDHDWARAAYPPTALPPKAFSSFNSATLVTVERDTRGRRGR